MVELTPGSSNLIGIDGQIMGFKDFEEKLVLSDSVSISLHREESVLTS